MKVQWLALFGTCILLDTVTGVKVEQRGDGKYFHEPGSDELRAHYDSRYFKEVVTYADRLDTLVHMTRAYLLYFQENGLETWIAHGTLLGWWWNGMTLPWDWDVDTQVNNATLYHLGDHYNQTIHEYVSEDKSVKREYLIDVNPHSRERQRGDGKNIIDARWIDMRNGLYIDITGLTELNPEKEPGVLGCKNKHRYKTSDIYPMRESIFEGVPAKIPYKYDEILLKEYHAKAMVRTNYQSHDWFPDLKEWVPDEKKLPDAVRRVDGEKKDEDNKEEDSKEEQ